MIAKFCDTNISAHRHTGQRLLVGSRCLLSTDRRSQFSFESQEVKHGGHPDRTKLEGDIYDDTPDLEAEQQFKEAEKQDEEHEAVLKRRLLTAALHFVPEHGWTKKAIVAGATAEGLPPLAHGLISRGPVELVHHFYDSANQNLANKLAKEVKDVELGNATKKGVTVFIRDAVTHRLHLLIPYLDTWPQAMGLMAQPQNVLESLKHLSHLVDDVWYYAGDRSTDFNWYTKRATLAAAYKSTELHLLQDKSTDYVNTWKFLDRRLQDFATVGKGFRQMQDKSGSLGNFLLGSTIVARNVFGINDRQR